MFCVVLSSAGSRSEAMRIGRTLVEERLAACVTVIPAGVSIYRWRGRVERSREALLLIKTRKSRIKNLMRRLREKHSYELPEVLVLDVSGGSKEYLKWLKAETGKG
ncbi:MAG: divalent-cation tolerance protein CutA [Candidatus Hadarchaeales archaeon]